MQKKYILALDEGTTSARALLYDAVAGKITSVISKSFEQHYPHPSWVEHNPDEVWRAQKYCLTEVLRVNRIKPEQIYSIGITNQRETVVVWDKESGKPLYNAIVWQCRRTSDFCANLKTKGLEPIIKQKTGLPIDAYFSASKIRWVLDNVEGARAAADKGVLCAGTMDTFIISKLTGGKSFVTDYTNACRTQLFNINTLCWDEELCDIFGVPKCMLPKVVSCSEIVGYWNYNGVDIPIAGIAGDQQSALFGQGCFYGGMAKNTYGTGCFMLMNTGDKPVHTKKLITTIAWGIDGKITYALEGSIFNAGSVVQWLRDEMGIIEKSSDTEAMAFAVDDTAGVYFIPAFTGLGAPYWDMEARGTIVGITRGANKNHIVRAAMESMAYNTKAIFDEMQKDSGICLQSLRCDGGVSKDGFLMQFQSDLLGCATQKQHSVECTAMGAIYLAGLAVSAFESIEQIEKSIKMVRVYQPKMDKDDAQQRYLGWQKAVNSLIAYEEI